MILTLPVLVYQAFFVVVLHVASRFGPRWLLATAAACLLWTATHLFFVPLAVLQVTVILVATALFYSRARLKAKPRP